MTTKPRRPKLPAPQVELSVRMPKPMAERLRELAAARDTSASALVRRLVLVELVRAFGGDVELGIDSRAAAERLS